VRKFSEKLKKMKFSMLYLLVLPTLVRSQCCDDVCGEGNVCLGSCVLGVVECYCENSCSGTYTLCYSNACGGVSSDGICFGGEGCDCWGGSVGSLCVGTVFGILAIIGIIACVICCCCTSKCSCYNNDPPPTPSQFSRRSAPKSSYQSGPRVNESNEMQYA